MRFRRWVVFAVVAMAVGFSASNAQGERPYFFISPAEPLSQGTARLEGGLRYERFSRVHDLYALESSLFFGVVNNLDFEVSIPYLFLSESTHDDSGVGDVTLRSRLRLIKAREANPLTVSAQLVIKLPSASSSKSLGTGESDIGINMLASKQFEPLNVHLNVGYLLVGDPPGKNFKNEFHYGLGFDIDTTLQGVLLFTEIGGNTNRDSSAASDPLAVTFGVVAPIGRRTHVDAGLAVGLTSASPSYTASVGASYRF